MALAFNLAVDYPAIDPTVEKPKALSDGKVLGRAGKDFCPFFGSELPCW
jgi:hypothetical protein